ncbi:EamA-like transporter family protein [Pseudovibrio sp. Ad13]|uniref:DMT family transporter n=1 Tax=unclassified Pseudovibrio TaxID=2627060 RepID=UPI0007AEE35A|nr:MULTISPECIES: DMT family transporter [unclassified Pseudovibrio]KZK76075.1 EamA-like transporter family protein [Pseudovibrio sp. Ad13]KZK88661.1 EamA-like transporter family protein [Pseudovibrio sp. Ad46]KZK91117.1 EamA-like transporter family protein [Pseudovibrio sp. Ad5]KZL24069.1 EamA-like transporter family protein [Pseudovibrio sp. Ad37]
MAQLLGKRNMGIALTILSTLIFAMQDAITKQLVSDHPVWFIMMVRFWVLLVIAVGWAMISEQGLYNVVRTKRPVLQIIRGLLLFAEICLITFAFSMLGLADVTAIFQAHPLIVTGLAALFLGETVGWRRILAMFCGMAGLLVMLQPDGNIGGWGAVVALAASVSFALYQLFTRVASQDDSALTSFLYVGIVGTVLSTIIGSQHMMAFDEVEWALLLGICATGTSAHFLLMKALSLAQASDIQPFNYLQLVWSIPIGFLVFSDLPIWSTILGAIIVVGAGLFSLSRQRIRAAEKETGVEPETSEEVAARAD